MSKSVDRCAWEVKGAEAEFVSLRVVGERTLPWEQSEGENQ